MLLFNSKKKAVKALADTLIAHSEKLADDLQNAFNGQAVENERTFIFKETLLLLIHLVGRIGDRQLNNSQNNGLFNMLGKCVAEHMATCVQNIKNRNRKEAAIRKFFDDLAVSETDYSMCSEGFIETKPFSENALFSKFARKIVDGKNKLELENHTSVDDSRFHAEMTRVLDMFLALYPKLNLEHQVLKAGKNL